MYWLGWFPVAPLNMILASFYIADRFGLNTTSGFTPINTLDRLVDARHRGRRASCCSSSRPTWASASAPGFATVLGDHLDDPADVPGGRVWLFTGDADWGQLSGFHQLDGTGFFTGLDGHGWFPLYMGYAFLLTWNVIAMEAAACYIGETRDPERDAKIAMNLEGGYGLVHLHADPDRVRHRARREGAVEPRPRRPEHDLRHVRRRSSSTPAARR